jgi:hypothetical protein
VRTPPRHDQKPTTVSAGCHGSSRVSSPSGRLATHSARPAAAVTAPAWAVLRVGHPNTAMKATNSTAATRANNIA